jgi:hypothetical protein
LSKLTRKPTSTRGASSAISSERPAPTGSWLPEGGRAAGRRAAAPGSTGGGGSPEICGGGNPPTAGASGGAGKTETDGGGGGGERPSAGPRGAALGATIGAPHTTQNLALGWLGSPHWWQSRIIKQPAGCLELYGGLSRSITATQCARPGSSVEGASGFGLQASGSRLRTSMAAVATFSGMRSRARPRRSISEGRETPPTPYTPYRRGRASGVGHAQRESASGGRRSWRSRNPQKQSGRWGPARSASPRAEAGEVPRSCCGDRGSASDPLK